MRKLCSIEKIEWLRPIEGRDFVELAGVLGWQVIVKKGEFSVGDLCVYVEIDSQLPEKPEFEFLRPKKFRIKTMKLSGVVSQGIVFPLTILPAREMPYEIGEDVTELMGVVKYEPQEDDDKWWKDLRAEPVKKKWYQKLPLMRFEWYRKRFGPKKTRGNFPSFISKTDETRIQAAPWMLDDDEMYWVATEKVDGTSGTFAVVRQKHKFRKDTFEYIVCSRNMRLQRDGSVYWKVFDKYNLSDVLLTLLGSHDWVAIQGECIGPKIQKNKYKRTEPELYAFNLVYPDGRRPSIQAKNLLNGHGVPFVPIVWEQFTLPSSVEDMIALAHGKSALSNTLREGLVVRSVDGKKSFKAVDPEFLLKYGE